MKFFLDCDDPYDPYWEGELGLILCSISKTKQPGTNWKSIIFSKLTSDPLEMCLIDPISVTFTPQRFLAFSTLMGPPPPPSPLKPPIAALSNVLSTAANQTLIKTSAFLSFVRMIYLPSSTSEVWGWASSAFLKRRKYALLGGKKKRGGRKVGEANRNKRQTEGEGWMVYV